MRRTTAILAATLVLLSAGCGTPAEHVDSALVVEPPPYEWVAVDDFSIRWTTVPGIDLDAPEVLVARAFGESEAFYDKTGRFHSTYEGFTDAVPNPIAEDGRTYPVTGTLNNHVIEVRTLPDRFGRQSYRVTFCSDESDTAVRTGDAWKASGTGSSLTFILSITRIDADVPLPRVNTAVRTPHPSWNVFEGWEIQITSGWKTSFFSVENPEDHALFEYCLYEHPSTNENFRYGDLLDAPPVAQPSVPGWPQRVEGP
jgi:hypothetical protein